MVLLLAYLFKLHLIEYTTEYSTQIGANNWKEFLNKRKGKPLTISL
jgi:hypothetical protein